MVGNIEEVQDVDVVEAEMVDAAEDADEGVKGTAIMLNNIRSVCKMGRL